MDELQTNPIERELQNLIKVLIELTKILSALAYNSIREEEETDEPTNPTTYNRRPQTVGDTKDVMRDYVG